MIGTTIGNYEVQRLVGEGGMGKVYLAVHPGIGQRAAVKVLPPSDAADPETLSRFITEARAAIAIRHPNIVHVYDSGVVEGGSAYIVMEYLEGETLTQALAREPISLEDAIDWGCQVAEALAAAHAQDVIHRDLKPDNLFLVADPRRPGKRQVKVLDFGVAKLQRHMMDQAHKTRTGALLGTPLYMSPEQCSGSKEIDARCDIYSLGLILYEMVTGQRPFDGEGMLAVIYMHLNDQPRPPTSFRPDLPTQIEDIILQALAKAPEQRQASMAEVLCQLRTAVGEAVDGSRDLARLASAPVAPATTAKRFGRDEILAFLADIDQGLAETVLMEIVGGAAALLAYGAHTPTKDINSYSDFDEGILRAALRAAHRIPLQRTVKPKPPFNHEERRQRLTLPPGKLVVWVPERHDVLFTKLARAARHDLEVIEEMHRAKPFDLQVIVERYNDEIVRTFGGNDHYHRQLQLLIDRLFGARSFRRLAKLTGQ